MKPSWTRWCMVLGCSALAACSPEKPFEPGLYSITGHLRLTGYIVREDGSFAGTRVLGDADGVLVELLRGAEVVARTTTVDGAYRFSGLRPGGYVARSQVAGTIADQTTPMTIAVADVAAADTIRLVPRGDLHPVPNPFVDTTQVDFNVPDTMHVDVDVYDVGGRHLRSLLSLEVLPTRHAVFWDGTDRLGHPVPGSLFWITYVADPDVRAQLLFREVAPRPPMPARRLDPGRSTR